MSRIAPNDSTIGGLCRKLELGSPIPGLVATAGYLAAVSAIDSTSLVVLVAGFVLYVAACVAAVPLLYARELQPISRAFAASPRTRSATDALAATAALVRLPRRMRRVRLGTAVALGLVLPAAMALFGFPGWLFGSSLYGYAIALTLAALATAHLQHGWALASLRVWIEQLEPELPEPEIEAPRVERRPPLGRAAVAGLTCAVAGLLALDLVDRQHDASVRAEALRWAGAALEELADESGSASLPSRIDRVRDGLDAWPVPVALAAVSPERTPGAGEGGLSTAMSRALGEASADGASEGTLDAPRSGELGRFRRLADGSLVVAVIGLADLPLLGARGAGARGLLIVGLAGLGAAWAWLALEARRRDLDALVEAAAGCATGEARPNALSLRDDRTGDLARALHAASGAVRGAIDHVEAALEQVETTAFDTLTLVSDVASRNTDLRERLGRANALVGSIDARAQEVSHSAERLNESIDDSSSSVAELGATGAELNETASVLTSKVDEVSDSMEQMVRSVQQVAATTERLSTASEETSSSMEEMASAMRMVDTSAETTAKLSRDVVEKAEVGHTKVRQTIDGMEAIQQATATAERVIRGLGVRTHEIGGILDVIDDVADETNLLALNAAIIAAQAGEQGKAFSVVADEIKELADRVLASTKEIGELIRSVQEESENAIGAIEAGTRSVRDGVDLSVESGRTLEEITEASRESGMRIGEIVTSVREQTHAAGHVVMLMERVRESSEEIATASEQQTQGNEVVYRSALTMREVAQQVRRTTEEQSRGFGRIRESVEGVRGAVEQIDGALREQTGACQEIGASLEHASEGTRAHEEAIGKLERAMKELLSVATGLREDVGRFRIS